VTPTEGPSPGAASLAAAILHEQSHGAVARSRTQSGDTRDTAAPDSLLHVGQVDYSYGKVQVLFDIDLAVRRGDTIALLGTNGAGKSTLMRIISGLAAPQHGTVRFAGREITATRAEHRARLGIVQLTGGNATFPPLTVADNLRAGAYRYRRADADERVGKALELFPVLGDRLKARAADLSGGQQHILALAIALMHDPEILLIDEMSIGLAPVIVQQVVEVVRALKERGTTMIIVEQSLNLALSIADRAVVMEKGRVRFDGMSHELAEHAVARSVFLGA
jgi:ABC-type branched-subunit amino acid transport system ATPase component